MEPTDHLPGSENKIEVLRQRASEESPLHHPQDYGRIIFHLDSLSNPAYSKSMETNELSMPDRATIDQSWYDTKLIDLFPGGLAEKFRVAKLFTLGQLFDFLCSGRSCKNIKGIGPKSVEQIGECLKKFWEKWESNP